MYNRNRQPYNIRDSDWKVVSKILATSSAGKARYLKDFKPFSSVFTVYNLTLQVGKAAAVSSNLVALEANQHDMRQRTNPEQKLPEFDWELAIKKQYWPFINNSIRFCSTSVIKKILEEVALVKLPARLVDKLTKDVWQSLRRKALKFGHYLACQKIFFTHLHANLLFNAANFIFDLVHAGISHIYTLAAPAPRLSEGKKAYVQPLKTLGFIANRITYYGAISTFSAAGYSAGSFCNEKYGGFLGALVLEVVAQLALAGLPY